MGVKMKGEVYKEQGAYSYTAATALQNRLVEAGIMWGISTNMIHFYGLKTGRENTICSEDRTCPKKTDEIDI